MLSEQELLEMERPVSARHAPMRRCDRAAQFAPFAALSGFGDAVREAGRLTQARIELTESECEALNDALVRLAARLPDAHHLFSARRPKNRRRLPHGFRPRPQAGRGRADPGSDRRNQDPV